MTADTLAGPGGEIGSEHRANRRMPQRVKAPGGSMDLALKIALPETERGVSAEVLQRFDKAKRALNNPMTKPRARDAHARTLAHIENAPREAREADWLERSTRETIALAQARGEDVETDKAGRKRIRSRDSLLNLISAGKLTGDAARVGLECREAYELREQGLGAMNYTDAGRGGRDHGALIQAGLARALKTQMVSFIERYLALELRADPQPLTMFRAILRDRKSLNDFGDSEQVRQRCTSALILAIETAVSGKAEFDRQRRDSSPHVGVVG